MTKPSLESFRYTHTGDPRKQLTFELAKRETEAREAHINTIGAVSQSAMRYSGLQKPSKLEKVGSNTENDDVFRIPKMHSKDEK